MRERLRFSIFSLRACVLSFAVLTAAAANVPDAVNTITKEKLLGYTRQLASDEFEGRGPGTAGEEKTVRYLVEEFTALGLKPGNPDGSWFQEVPMVGMTCVPTISFSVKGAEMAMKFPEDSVVWTKRFVPELEVKDSEVVFVGYGIVAPEYGWDDYKGLDVRGKTLVMLVGDPPIPDAKQPGQLDAKMFKGKAMTYYGRWTYKYEIAAEKGAAAAIIVHETGPAGYPWAVVVGSNSRENFDLKVADKNAGRAAVEGWVTQEQAQRLLGAAGQDYAKLKQAALAREFRPAALAAKANFQVKVAMRELKSRNVVARLDGQDARLRQEHIIYTAHWDHLGRDEKLAGDQIYNGALDNATGTAGLLELARAFKALRPGPKRSVLFIALTAEEKGLLGAKHYAAQPLYPLADTIANLNMDMLNPWGPTEDVSVIGFGSTTIENVLKRLARVERRSISPDSEPEKGRFFRSDHFEFAKKGVPALYMKGGDNYRDKPKDFSLEKMKDYIANDYHKVSDEIKADWDLAGAVEDLKLLFLVGQRLTRGDLYPTWLPGSEFKARHEELRKSRRK